MSPIDHPINQMNIKLSKHFGLIKTLNFSLFPNLSESYPWRRFEELNLLGLSKPNLGVQNIGWFDVFDFQQGDEIHVLYDYSCDEFTEITKTITKYLSRSDYPDSIVYETEVERNQTKLEFGEGPTTYSKYNKKITIQKDTLFAKLPGEPIIEDDIAWYYSMRVDQDGHIIKTEPADYDHIRFSKDSCWTEDCCWDGCWPSYDYYKGLGGPYYHCYPWCLGEIEQSLVYYKKGDVIWGNPFNLTSVEDNITQNPIKILPNPTSDYLTIEIPESYIPATFELYDLSGKLVLLQTVDKNISQISMISKKGQYIYKLVNNQLKGYSGTILVE